MKGGRDEEKKSQRVEKYYSNGTSIAQRCDYTKEKEREQREGVVVVHTATCT